MNQKANFEDLLNNDFFIKWVKDKPSQSEWNTFIKESPLSQEEIQAARSIIEQVSKPISRTNSNNIKDDVWKSIESVTLPQKRYSKFWLGCLLLSLIIALSSVYILYVKSSKVENVIALDVSDQWITYTNTSESNWPIDLADGSQVVLEPYANLKYPRLFNSTSRKVELEGNAYFDITHDTLKPFYVYANEALIRVLGTSFYVKADEEDKDIKVIVETGKVAVYKGESVKKYQAKKIEKLKPLLVTPNQIATLQKSNLKFNKRLVSRPMITQPLESLQKIHFENSSIHEIAKALEKAYGIEIVLGNNISTSCRLTTTLTDQPFFEKLKIICDPLGLEYIERDVRIYITGNCEN